MGRADGSSDESMVHEVCFQSPFWIDIYEVTNEQYGSTGCESLSAEPTQPRNCVNWLSSVAHCEARGARLPTEAEWEYAARGPDNLAYPWGDTFEAENVLYYGNNTGGPASVGSKPDGVSWIGAYDMSGNVWDWVNDWYSDTYYGTLEDGVVNPSGPSAGDFRVLRGGSWVVNTVFLSTTHRYRDVPSNQDGTYGFRCAAPYIP